MALISDHVARRHWTAEVRRSGVEDIFSAEEKGFERFHSRKNESKKTKKREEKERKKKTQKVSMEMVPFSVCAYPVLQKIRRTREENGGVEDHQRGSLDLV